MSKKDFLIITLFLALFLCVGYSKFVQKRETLIIKVENSETSITTGNTITEKIDYIQSGYECFKIENFDCLIRESAMAIKDDPLDAMAYNNRAYGYLRIGDLNKAESDIEKALSLEPNHTLALNNRGLLRIKQKKFDLAIKDITSAENNDPTIPEIYLNKGFVMVGKLQYKKAIDEFNKAIEIQSDMAIAYEERGKIYQILKETQKAEKDFLMAKRIRKAYKN